MHCLSWGSALSVVPILCIASRDLRFRLQFYISLKCTLPNWDGKCEVWLVSIFSFFYQVLLKLARRNFNHLPKYLKSRTCLAQSFQTYAHIPRAYLCQSFTMRNTLLLIIYKSTINSGVCKWVRRHKLFDLI